AAGAAVRLVEAGRDRVVRLVAEAAGDTTGEVVAGLRVGPDHPVVEPAAERLADEPLVDLRHLGGPEVVAVAAGEVELDRLRPTAGAHPDVPGPAQRHRGGAGVGEAVEAAGHGVDRHAVPGRLIG